jgi:hypothetical protein
LFSALYWLPLTALSMLVAVATGGATGFLSPRHERNEADLKHTRFMRALIVASLLLSFVAMILMTDLYRGGWIFPAALLLIAVVFSFIGRSKLEPKRPMEQFTIWSAILLTMAFTNGLWDGFQALRALNGVYAVRLKGEEQDRHFPLLRNFTRGVLVHDPFDKRIVFHKWEEIQYMASHISPPTMTPFACAILNLPTCPATPPDP